MTGAWQQEHEGALKLHSDVYHCKLDSAFVRLGASASTSSITRPLLPFDLAMDENQEFPLLNGVTFLMYRFFDYVDER